MIVSVDSFSWDIQGSPDEFMGIQKGLDAASSYYMNTRTKSDKPVFDSIAFIKGWLMYCKARGIICGVHYSGGVGAVFRDKELSLPVCPADTITFPDMELLNVVKSGASAEHIKCCLLHGAAVHPKILLYLTEDTDILSWKYLFKASPGWLKPHFVELAAGLLRKDMLEYCIKVIPDLKYHPIKRIGQWVRNYITPSISNSISDATRRGLIKSEADITKKIRDSIRYRINEFTDYSMITLGHTALDPLTAIETTASLPMLEGIDIEGEWDIFPTAVPGLSPLLVEASFNMGAVEGYIKRTVDVLHTTPDADLVHFSTSDIKKMADLIVFEPPANENLYTFILEGVLENDTSVVEPEVLANKWLWLMKNDAYDAYLEKFPKDPHIAVLKTAFYAPDGSIVNRLPSFKAKALAIVALKTDNATLFNYLITDPAEKLKLAAQYASSIIMSENFTIKDLTNPDIIRKVLPSVSVPRMVYMRVYIQLVPTETLVDMFIRDRETLPAETIQIVEEEIISRIRWYFHPTEKRVGSIGGSLHLWWDINTPILVKVLKVLKLKVGINYLDNM